MWGHLLLGISFSYRHLPKIELIGQGAITYIYIGCGETEGMREVIRAIASLHQSCPRIRVHLTSGNAELVTDRLEKGLLDFALLCRSTPPMEYVYRKLSHEDVWGLFMRRDNPLAGRDGISASDLLTEPLIASKQAVESKEFDHWLGQPAEQLNIVATYNLAYNSAFLVEQGFGSMLGFAGLIPTGRQGRTDIVFRPLLPRLHSHNYLAWKKGQVFSRAGRLVVDAFEEVFS